MNQNNNRYYNPNYVEYNITSADLDDNGNYYIEKNFIHFDTIGQAELFKQSYRNLHYGHRCCDGKGVLVYNKTSCELNNLKKQLFLNNTEKKKTSVKGKISECGICYDIKTLIKMNCDHSFCNDCISEWIKISNSCPMCRSVIN